MGVGNMRHQKGWRVGIMRNFVSRGKGQNAIAASVVAGRSCPSSSQGGTSGQALKLTEIHWRICRNHNDDRTLITELFTFEKFRHVFVFQ